MGSPGLVLSLIARAWAGWAPQAVLAVPPESPPAGDVVPAEQMFCSEYEGRVASFWVNV